MQNNSDNDTDASNQQDNSAANAESGAESSASVENNDHDSQYADVSSSSQEGDLAHPHPPQEERVSEDEDASNESDESDEDAHLDYVR